MKKIISLIAFTAMLAVPAFAQTSANVRVNSLNALVQLPILSTNMSAMVSGNAAIGDGGYAGDFTYDSTSSAPTNAYSVFKPAATTGRWIRRNSAAWNQFTAATANDSTTYAFSMQRNLSTNVFNLGADNNNVYLQSQANYSLHLNNQGNDTVVGGGLRVTGAIDNIAADSLAFDNFSSANRMFITGPDATTVGALTLRQVESDGGGLLIPVEIQTDGDVILNQSTGNTGVGTTTPISLLEAEGGLTTVGAVFTLGTKEPSVVLNDVLGRINFYAPLDAAGTDANLVAGSIATVAEGTFSATSNASSLVFQTGASEVATTKLTISSAGNVTVANGNVLLGTAGNGFQIKEGSNARMGTATLSGGTIAVSNTSAATGDRIFIQRVSGTAAEFGHLSYTISNGVSFTINSTDAQDDSVVNWLIIKPTP